MILRGIFLVTQAEFDWFYRDGTPLVFPEAAQRFHALAPEGSGGETIAAYHALITGTDQQMRRRALEEWARWEAETLSLHRNAKRIAQFTSAEFAEAFAGIELHYFINKGFLRFDGQLLAEAEKIRDIPGVIVHGRYDMICPVRNAVRLAEIWRAAELRIIADAGHTAFEPGITDVLVRATDAFRD
jgi:proline iminopeptidase